MNSTLPQTSSPLEATGAVRHRVAVVYHYLAHYRGPVFRALSRQQEPDPVYTIVSATESNLPSLETVDPALARLPPEEGGIRWRFVKNFFVGPLLVQTGVLRLSVSDEFDTLIYLGDAHFVSTWVAATCARLTGKRVLMWTQGFLREERGLKGWLRLRFDGLAHG